MKTKYFKIEALKSGYVVELRNGSRYIVTRVGQSKFSKVLANKNSALSVNSYDKKLHYTNEFLKHLSIKSDDFDIVRIWGLSDDPLQAFCISEIDTRPLLWERPPVKKMTISDIEDILGYSVEIVEEV